MPRRRAHDSRRWATVSTRCTIVPGGPVAAVERAEALFIGGGNTFRLLDALWRHALIEPIRRRVQAGMPYVGTSAGSNVACPSIRTTNDMPIVQPPSFAALNLVPFNINPHYQDPIPGSTHMGETREQRIAEFHEENAPPVVGLREGAWLLVEDSTVVLSGSTGARLFRRGEAPAEFATGSRLDFLAQHADRKAGAITQRTGCDQAKDGVRSPKRTGAITQRAAVIAAVASKPFEPRSMSFVSVSRQALGGRNRQSVETRAVR